jgi:ferritin-like metal-binding protein YciE
MLLKENENKLFTSLKLQPTVSFARAERGLLFRHGAQNMKLSSLEELFVDELKDLYSAETQLLKALPKMAGAATCTELKKGFQKHLKQTQGHVARLKKVCSDLDVTPTGKTCQAMQGLIKEGQETIDEDAEPEVKDAALIAAAQRVEHYEIAGYGCVRTYAQLLKNKKAAQLLQQTLNEEGETDKTLTKLAKSINVEAAHPVKNGSATARKGKTNAKSFTKRLRTAVGL